MRFKLDENADPRWREPLLAAGHHADSVADEQLGGADDPIVAAACQADGRCLITADVGFGQILEYPPGKFAGIVVLRHPRPTISGMLALIRALVSAVQRESPVGRLWIVEPGRIRVHSPPGAAPLSPDGAP